MIEQLATVQMDIAVVQEIDATNQLLRKMNDLMPIEQVEAILDEHQEHTERVNEINRLVNEDLDPEATQAADDAYERMLAELGGEPAPQEEAYDEGEAEGDDMVALPA
jgi:hypothetical protein